VTVVQSELPFSRMSVENSISAISSMTKNIYRYLNYVLIKLLKNLLRI